VLALALALAAIPALADSKGKGHGKNKGNDWKGPDWSQPYSVRACPPGLAKKNPPCVPPGQAKKQVNYTNYDAHDHYRYRRGEYLPRDADYLRDPSRYRLPDGTYYVDNGFVYRVDPQTLEVMALVGLLDRLLN
jgi:hypothetical protein